MQTIASFWAELQPYVNFLNVNPAIQAAIFAVLGAVVGLVGRAIVRTFAVHRELRHNKNIKLGGRDWFAAWQAAADNEQVINIESLVIKQKGSRVAMYNKEKSPDNPKGGYKWRAKLDFAFGETLMGWYFPVKKENITSRGIMYFAYDAQRRVLCGRWVGKAIDGPLCSGFVAIAKSPELARANLDALIEKAKEHPVNIISTDFLKTSGRRAA